MQAIGVSRRHRYMSKDGVGWTLALLLPSVLAYLLSHCSISWACANFIVIFSCALVMWIFRLVPEYTPAVFVILATMLLGLAPQAVLLSGFTSDSFYLALSVFGIGAVLIKSNLFYRVSLLILKHLPGELFMLQLAVFSIGVLLTPLMTAQSARLSLITPLIENINAIAGLKKRSIATNSIAYAAYHGCILFSIVFLTGKSSNFVLYGMMPESMQWQFSWNTWLLSALVPAFILLAAFVVSLKYVFKTSHPLSIDRIKLKQELKELGPLCLDEWASILSVLVLIVGIITSSWHQIPIAWLCFAILFILMTSGIFTKADFKNNINWPFLFYLGSIIGIMSCIQVIGLSEWILAYLSWIAKVAEYNYLLFIVLIYAIGWLSCILFGTAAAPALLFTILLPIAQDAALNVWVIAFTLLMSTESWLFPYQSSYFICFEEAIEEKRVFRLASILKTNAFFIFMRLLAILASIPFWNYIKLL